MVDLQNLPLARFTGTRVPRLLRLECVCTRMHGYSGSCTAGPVGSWGASGLFREVPGCTSNSVSPSAFLVFFT